MGIDNFHKAQQYLTEWGFRFSERPNFATAKAANTKPQHQGVLFHHTGAWTTPDTMLYISGNGRVPAPLCNISVDRDGEIVFGAANYANHAGYNNEAAAREILAGGPLDREVHPGSDSRTYSGNRYFVGVEIKAPASYNAEQYPVAVALGAALVLGFGWERDCVPIGAHKEVTKRKPSDPGDDMAKFRRDVIAFIAAKTDPGPVPVPVPVVPTYPLKAGYYFGPKTKGLKSISGYQSKLPNGHTGDHSLAQWQAQAKLKGYTIAVDGLFGNQTRGVALRMQKAAGFKASDQDGYVGKLTWPIAW